MSDVHSNETRHYNMSQIRGKDTKPEIIVRKYLFSRGLRYRKHDRRYPGCPDIVLPKYRVVILVHGCFWHIHEGCPCFVMPKTRLEFWENKFKQNKRRDIQNIEKLKSLGWRVIVIWECELKKYSRNERLERLYGEVTLL